MPTKGKRPIQCTVLLVDDHTIWRCGVRSMLQRTEFAVIGEASSGHEAIELARKLNPTLVLLDIRMVGGDGLDTLQILKQKHPRMAVVMLTTYDNPTYMARAVAGGASGYLLKGIAIDRFIASLRAVASGESLLTAQDLSHYLRGIKADSIGVDDLIKPLTAREVEVLRLVATGITNREIAAILFIAEGTVKTHVEHITGKLGVSDRVQAAVWAMRHGLSVEAK